jgi:hypothetical protein
MENNNYKPIALLLFLSLIILASQVIFDNIISTNGIKIIQTVRYEEVTIVKKEEVEKPKTKSLYDYIIVAKYKDSDEIYHFVVFQGGSTQNQSIYDFIINPDSLTQLLPPFYNVYEIGNHINIDYNPDNMGIIEVTLN